MRGRNGATVLPILQGPYCILHDGRTAEARRRMDRFATHQKCKQTNFAQSQRTQAVPIRAITRALLGQLLHMSPTTTDGGLPCGRKSAQPLQTQSRSGRADLAGAAGQTRTCHPLHLDRTLANTYRTSDRLAAIAFAPPLSAGSATPPEMSPQYRNPVGPQLVVRDSIPLGWERRTKKKVSRAGG